ACAPPLEMLAPLDGLLENAPVGFTYVDTDLRYAGPTRRSPAVPGRQSARLRRARRPDPPRHLTIRRPEQDDTQQSTAPRSRPLELDLLRTDDGHDRQLTEVRVRVRSRVTNHRRRDTWTRRRRLDTVRWK
ncbi:MAG: hypothetical protein L0K86_15250, partial [Actinomycetia bacterium]|nr:hypothetical protein [Actinomycetes bacterium]